MAGFATIDIASWNMHWRCRCDVGTGHDACNAIERIGTDRWTMAGIASGHSSVAELSARKCIGSRRRAQTHLASWHGGVADPAIQTSVRYVNGGQRRSLFGHLPTLECHRRHAATVAACTCGCGAAVIERGTTEMRARSNWCSGNAGVGISNVAALTTQVSHRDVICRRYGERQIGRVVVGGIGHAMTLHTIRRRVLNIRVYEPHCRHRRIIGRGVAGATGSCRRIRNMVGRLDLHLPFCVSRMTGRTISTDRMGRVAESIGGGRTSVGTSLEACELR